jgi:hypothetical protein
MTIHLISLLTIPLKVTPSTCQYLTITLSDSTLGYQIGIQGMQQLGCGHTYGPCTISSISCGLDAHKLEFKISRTTSETAPIILIHCMIYRRAHQILQCYICC